MNPGGSGGNSGKRVVIDRCHGTHSPGLGLASTKSRTWLWFWLWGHTGDSLAQRKQRSASRFGASGNRTDKASDPRPGSQ